MRITSKGQVTIPRDIRQKAGMLPQTDVEFFIEGNTVVLKPVQSMQSRGRRITEALRGRATVKMTTEEIMALTREEL
jgi:AbrB family looped-hinge helix DNA binding protein